MERGARRAELKVRYDVPTIVEDEWHSYTEQWTRTLVSRALARCNRGRLLNAGCGSQMVEVADWVEVSLDLFPTPIAGRTLAVCGDLEALPFASATFAAVICVGEVLAYCDPARALWEAARVLTRGGILILDFGSSASVRHWFTPTASRAADRVVVPYNGKPERTWVYSPKYISALLSEIGLVLRARYGTHFWSAAASRLGLSADRAVWFQRLFSPVPLPPHWTDIVTIVAEKA